MDEHATSTSRVAARPEMVPVRLDNPHPVEELLRMIEDENPQPVIAWLRRRPHLSEIVVREANSVQHALVRRIESVDHAVIYLGRRGMARLAERLAAASARNRHANK